MYFELHGRADPAAPTIILSSGLGGSGAYWTPQIAALASDFRIVTYDHRGCGRTGGDVPPDGGIGAMADDVLQIVEQLDLSGIDFMGHALGGLIGLDLALRRPKLIRRLVLVNAWSKADPQSGRCFDTRLELLEKSGVPAFVNAQPLFLYPGWWMADNAERLAADDAHGVAHFQGETNIKRRIAALRAFDVESRLGEITAETLVVAARDDLLVPFQRSSRLAEGLPNATLSLFESGAHALNIVQPEKFNETVLHFLLADGNSFGKTSDQP